MNNQNLVDTPAFNDQNAAAENAAPSFNDNNQFNNQVPQFNNQAPQFNNQAPQFNGQVPQYNQNANYGQPQYNQTPVYVNPVNEKKDPETLGGWIGVLLLSLIPCVNIIMLFVWAFGNWKPSLKNYARAQLIIVAVIVVLYIIAFVVFGAAVTSLISDLLYYSF